MALAKGENFPVIFNKKTTKIKMVRINENAFIFLYFKLDIPKCIDSNHCNFAD